MTLCTNISEKILRRCHRKRSGYGMMFWTAGHRRGRPGTKFVWKVTSVKGDSKESKMRYTNWSRGEPNNYQKRNEVCVNLFSGHWFKWNDHNCYSEPMCFVCEIDLTT